MADTGTELAKAYVQIVPTTKGIQGGISQALGGEAEKAGTDAGNKIASGIKKAILGLGLGKILKDSLMAGADLQQSIGGIETLFGAGGQSIEEYAASVNKSVYEVKGEYEGLMAAQTLALDNANKAYQTAGLSANDYMQTVTGFAAALKGSTDNELEAAKAADMAVVDMADNVNKMGSSMESVQNAYAGFAKGNYTMLDNLKLGYGGTKSEMERLLKDAEKLSGVKYDINNLSDVYSAIHVIQTDLGITGTTAKEAASTFSGSMAAMKASASNVLAALSLGQDLTAPLQGMLDSVLTFLLDNAIPMIGNVLKAVPDLLVQGLDWVDSIGDVIGELLVEALEGAANVVGKGAPKLVTAAVNAVSGIIGGIASMDWSGIIPPIMEGINGIIPAIIGAVPQLISAGSSLLTGLLDGIMVMVPQILTQVPVIIQTLLTALTTNLPLIQQEGMSLLSSLISGIMEALPELLASGQQLITDLLTTITEMLPDVLTTGADLLNSLLDGIMEALPGMLEQIPQIITGIIETLTGMIPQIIQAGVKLLTSLVSNLPQIIGQIIPKVITIILNILSAIAKSIPQIVKAGFELFVSLIKELPKIIVELVKAIPQIIKGLVGGIKEHAGEMVSAGKDLLLGLGSGIGDAIGGVVAKAKEAASHIVSKVKGFFGIHSPSKVFAGIGEMLDMGLAEGIEDNLKPVQDAMSNLADETTGSIQADIVAGGRFAAAASPAPSRLDADVAPAEITVPLYLDGREIARASARYMGQQLAWEG